MSAANHRLCWLFGVLLLSASARSEVRREFIDPVLTGPGIRVLDELPGAGNRLLHHLVAKDPGRTNGYLYLHLAGSGGLPENSQRIADIAAGMGFSVVSLAYPNWPSVQELTGASGDLQAAGALRRERLFGDDASPLAAVDPANSVAGRLTSLLSHLAARYPDEGWQHFLALGQPYWDRIVVGGHSQGAGHAAFLSQEVPLAGVLMFGGPGDFVQGVGVAEWVARPLAIPSSRLYGFVHVQDPNYTLFSATQSILGLGESGPVEDVDNVAASAWRSNRLNSARMDVPGGNFHGAVVVDGSLPVNPGGDFAYDPVWQYMLGVALFRDSFGD